MSFIRKVLSGLTITALAASLMMLLAACSPSATDSEIRSDMVIDSYESGEFLIRLSYPAGPLNFGETAVVELDIEYPEESSYILLPPAAGDGAGFDNTVISSVEEKKPVYDGNGRVQAAVIFRIEAWLPGTVVIPPITVRFDRDISTDETEIEFISAFGEDEDSRELSPIYEPESASAFPAWLIITAAVAGKVLLVMLTVYIVRRRKRRAVPEPRERDRKELIADFRDAYIDRPEEIELREAFASLDALIDTDGYESYRELVDRIRFSAGGIAHDEGVRLLREIFGKFLEGEIDAL